MARTFSQITFDFARSEGPDATQTASPNEAKDSSQDVAVPAAAVSAAANENTAATLLSRPKSTRGRKAQKTYAAEADLVNIPEDELLFQRQYYSIGEVSQMFGVNASLLRFWESEFDVIKPRKNRKGDRHFRPVDIKNLQLIYDLLRRRKLTIEGAREFLKNNRKSQERFAMIQSLQKIKGFLLEIRAGLSQ